MKWWPSRKKTEPLIETLVSVDEEGNIFCFATRKGNIGSKDQADTGEEHGNKLHEVEH